MFIRQAIRLLLLAMPLISCRGGTGNLGEACEEKDDCEEGYCLVDKLLDQPTGWQAGYCSTSCNDATDCNQEQPCQILGAESVCLASCEQASDCREGYVCSPEWLACIPSCDNLGWSCGQELRCGSTGFCVAPSVGVACTSAEQCDTDLCIPAQDLVVGETYWNEGYCSTLCPDGGTCPDGSSCNTLEDSSYCLANCQSEDDCRDAYICDTDWFVCLPDCRQGWSCLATQTCNAGSGVCENPL